MRIELEQRRASLGVSEWAAFRIGPSDSGPGGSGRWRAAVGQRWHQTMRDRASPPRGGSISFEVPVQAVWDFAGWSIELKGRVDQWLVEASGVGTIREIKSVRGLLPLERVQAVERFADYWRQLAAYRCLMPLLPKYATVRSWNPELVLVSIDDGMVQTLPLSEEEAQRWFREQMETFTGFLEARAQTLHRLRRLEYGRPFEDWREGQAQAVDSLRLLGEGRPMVFFQAPTGFGKTGVALDWALSRLRQGTWDRVLYLSGKSTGQAPVMRQLGTMQRPGNGLRYFQLRNREEHRIQSPHHRCSSGVDCRTGIEASWTAAGLVPWKLFERGTVTLEEVRRLGARTGVCPYHLSRAILPHADLWVMDYNYVFGPRTRNVLSEIPGFEPARTLLIIDEAHNLPQRAADAWSTSIDPATAQGILDALFLTGAPGKLLHPWEGVAQTLFRYSGTQAGPLAPEESFHWRSLLEGLDQALDECGLPPGFPDDLSARFFEALAALHLLQHPQLDHLLWTEPSGRMHFSCLDAGPEIAPCLRSQAGVLALSATFPPRSSFRLQCGLEHDEGLWLDGHAPWREGAYSVAIDARVDTRLRARGQHLRRTASTILRFSAAVSSPAVAFFPSYRYAEEVLGHLLQLEPQLRVGLQPRGADLPSLNRFLDEALASAQVLLLVLGGTLAEGIDRLGGHVDGVLVVGPALPEVNCLQEARRQRRRHLGSDLAFRETYLVPGMVKVHQALGRIIRAPGQQARVLLHCRRFADPDFQDLLAPEFASGPVLRSDPAWENWISRPFP